MTRRRSIAISTVAATAVAVSAALLCRPAEVSAMSTKWSSVGNAWRLELSGGGPPEPPVAPGIQVPELDLGTPEQLAAMPIVSLPSVPTRTWSACGATLECGFVDKGSVVVGGAPVDEPARRFYAIEVSKAWGVAAALLVVAGACWAIGLGAIGR